MQPTHYEYEVSDLGLASALSCLGFRIKTLNRDNPRRVIFLFEGEQKGIDKAVNDFWEGTLKLPASSLFLHQKSLKQRLYANNV